LEPHIQLNISRKQRWNKTWWKNWVHRSSR